MRAKRILHTLVLLLGLTVCGILCAGDQASMSAGDSQPPVVAGYWDTN